MLDISPVAVVPAGGTPAVTQLFSSAQRWVSVYNTGATVYLGSGPGAGTAGITSSTGYPLGSAATYGPIGPLSGTLYATSSSGTVTVFVTTYAP
jgi:hypothetical protein